MANKRKAKKSQQRFFIFPKPKKKQLGKQDPIVAGPKNEVIGSMLTNFPKDELGEFQEPSPIDP